MKSLKEHAEELQESEKTTYFEDYFEKGRKRLSHNEDRSFSADVEIIGNEVVLLKV